MKLRSKTQISQRRKQSGDSQDLAPSETYSVCKASLSVFPKIFLVHRFWLRKVTMNSHTLTEVFSRFFLSCKANARVTLAKTGHGTHSCKLVVICVVLALSVLFCCYCVVLLLFVLFCYYLCCSMYCLCVNVYCTTATECLPNCS